MRLDYIKEKESLRRSWQNPEETLRRIGLRKGHNFLDVGCGYGFFTLPATRMVGKQGRVFGVDINEPAIEMIQHRLKEENLDATLSVARAEEKIFCEGCMDIVFFSIVLHDFENQHKVLSNARKMIKGTGILVNIDWKKKPLPLGPPLEKKFSPQHAISLIQDSGFRVVETVDDHRYLYTVIAKPE
jgi:ubiquinone/menaquinone biosynthesis C-methylase UbiE